jgi:DNA-binding PadR family transcriptional regulator
MKSVKNHNKMIAVWSKEIKKGYTSFLTLTLLMKRTMYGYEIKSELEKMMPNEITFVESGIYQILKKLRSKGFVTVEKRKSEKGPQRKYYTITENGRQLAKEFGTEYINPINSAVMTLISETTINETEQV